VNTLLDQQLLVSFCLTAAVINIMPGPSVMFIVSRSLAVGRPAVTAAAGNSMGSTFQGLLAALGVGSVISQSALLYDIITYGGAAYLVFIGVKTLLHPAISDNNAGSANRTGARREMRQGFLVGATNPKTIIFFAATLPQFVDPDRGNVLLQMLALLAVFGIMGLFTDTSWGFAGGTIRRWISSSPRCIERLIGAGGCCIIGVGSWMALSNGLG
jgi:threonine/homoserine/homoserine lactone efflux protein